MNKEDISSSFNNTGNVYYGHGIGADSQEVIDSIFENGLRCSHEQLYFTTIALGEGSDRLFEKTEETMNNWKHKDSKQIIIASLPKEYHLLAPMGTVLYGKGQAAFYNYFSQDEASKLGIASGYYLKPEFVSGVYDANTHSFTSNEKYYENLPSQEQKKIFEEVKRQYIDLLKGGPWTLEEYAEILKRTSGTQIPLTPEEIATADKEVFEAKKLEEQLQRIAEKSKQSDFKDATSEIRTEAQQQGIENEEEIYTDEGWSMDDWE